MKKYGLPLLIVAALIFAGYRLFVRNSTPVPKEKQKPLAIRANSAIFNKSFSDMLMAYYALKEALTQSDVKLASIASRELATMADLLEVDEIRGDTSGAIRETARFYTGAIKASATSLFNEKSISGKRKEFESITESVWTLTRTVKYDGQKVYYQYCPMAFDDKGAYYLSHERKIRNPYFGDKMLNCGEIADSLDYSNN